MIYLFWFLRPECSTLLVRAVHISEVSLVYSALLVVLTFLNLVHVVE